MIEQYLSNINESASVTKNKKQIHELNKALRGLLGCQANSWTGQLELILDCLVSWLWALARLPLAAI